MKNFKLLFMLFFASSIMMHTTVAQEIIAHRGASYDAPENTIAAVRLGFEQGADAVEVDVHLSKDNRIMVNHDKDTQRTAGKKLVVSETDASELRKLDVGSWKSKDFKGEKMPFLEEVLAEVPQGKILVIELKSDEKAVPFLKTAVNDSGIEEQVIIISFNKNAIIKAKEALPEVPAYWLLHNFNEYSLDEAIQIAKENELTGLDVHYPLANAEFMQKMNSEGLGVYVYTVNNANTAKKLKKLGVKGITTDRPQWLRKQIGR